MVTEGSLTRTWALFWINNNWDVVYFPLRFNPCKVHMWFLFSMFYLWNTEHIKACTADGARGVECVAHTRRSYLLTLSLRKHFFMIKLDLSACPAGRVTPSHPRATFPSARGVDSLKPPRAVPKSSCGCYHVAPKKRLDPDSKTFSRGQDEQALLTYADMLFVQHVRKWLTTGRNGLEGLWNLMQLFGGFGIWSGFFWFS